MKFLTGLLKRLLQWEGMAEEWRKNVFVSVFKGKGEIKEFGNYIGIRTSCKSYLL